jgi:UDP-glucose 4-epimerase
MKALVTGGAGFIGHHLARGLVERQDEVCVLDDLSSGNIARLGPIRDRLTFVQGSILDSAALDRAMAGMEVVFHEAALASVARSIVDPIQTNEVNVTGTIGVLLAAARHGVRRVVFAGSSAVYGTPERLPCSEHQRASPTSPYGVSKLAGELYLHALGSTLALETVALRYFNVYGPGQDPASEYAAVIPKFVTAVTRGDRPTIFGDGSTSRDFIYVADVVAANLLAASPETSSGLTCNVATGSETSLIQLLREICAAAGVDIEPIYGPPRVGDIPASVADVDVARRALRFEATVPLRDGMRRTVDWYSGLDRQGVERAG